MAAPAAHEFHWQSLARLSSGRVYHTLSEVGGQMYMLGGCDAAGRPCASLDLYSPEGDRWIALPPMPTPRAGAAVAVLGKQLLVVGGVAEDQSPTKVVEMYNTEEGRWRKRSALREALMGVSITVKGTDDETTGRWPWGAWVATCSLGTSSSSTTYGRMCGPCCRPCRRRGGRQCKRPLKAFEMYDSETRSWTTLPSMSCRRSYAGVIWEPSGRLCLLGGLRQGGGHQSSKFTKNVNIFDANQGAWVKSEETVAMKTKRADFVAASLRGWTVVAGGLGHQPSALDTVEALHPQKKKWERLAPMTYARCSASSIIIRDRLLVVGGVNQVIQHFSLLFRGEESCGFRRKSGSGMTPGFGQHTFTPMAFGVSTGRSI
ncbi:kelch domain-containing protein 8A isoform X2 [Synchiropus splendidus]|uniref:kelch domain-containing protein 8A isoform X2 n=1 Tax=Synchiropus splendidus TaxID=270530 RepID=UPI00237E3B61|nr:kelch domain-containing protein 8A isoform X2 [Synchiropus splendidus]